MIFYIAINNSKGVLERITGISRGNIKSKTEFLAYLTRRDYKYSYYLPNSCAYKITGVRDFIGTLWREDFKKI
jgi:hypothetical protein